MAIPRAVIWQLNGSAHQQQPLRPFVRQRHGPPCAVIKYGRGLDFLVNLLTPRPTLKSQSD